MEVALVYDRVNKWGGAERVLLALHEMFPNAPLYTSVYSPEKASWAKVFPQVIPSFLQKLYFLREKHELLAPLMPIAFESLDLTRFDFVISVTSEAAKGIITKPPTKHICYCLTPTRYLWSHYEEYFRGRSLQVMTRPLVSYLREWDRIAAQRPDVMIAISNEVKDRIKRYYGRESEIIYPPVETSKFQRFDKLAVPSEVEGFPISNNKVKKKNFFLVVSRLVPYKRVDLVIEAFNSLGYPLLIIGTGSEEDKLKKMANNNIYFEKYLTDEELAVYYQRARAFIMPQYEDFGLSAVEVQAAGTPVIAYQKGGVTDTVIDGKTGIFFEKQDKKSLINAIKRFDRKKFDKNTIIKNAQRFSKETFTKKIGELIEHV